MKKILGAVLLFTALFSATAQSSRKPDAGELAWFFDTVVPELMEKFHVVGAVVGVADGDETLLLRGYGSADLDS